MTSIRPGFRNRTTSTHSSLGAGAIAWRDYEAKKGKRTLVFVGVSNLYFRWARIFGENRRAAEMMTGRAPVRLETSFHGDFKANGARLFHELKQAYEKNGRKPLVVFTNPTTSVDALYAMTVGDEGYRGDFDPLAPGVIDRVVMVQPAFGTPLADRLARFLPIKPVRKNVTSEVTRGVRASVQGLSPQRQAALRSKVLIVPGSSDQKHTNPLLRLTRRLFLRSPAPNDGVSYERAQLFSELGFKVLKLGAQADHFIRTYTAPYTRVPFEKRTAVGFTADAFVALDSRHATAAAGNDEA